MWKWTVVEGRSLPIAPGEVTVVSFSKGRGGAHEEGPWEFWTAVRPTDSEPCTTRCKLGDDPGQRFRRTRDRSGEAWCYLVVKAAPDIHPATADEVQSWLRQPAHKQDVAETCWIAGKLYRVDNTGAEPTLVPVPPPAI
jgi:hypothetical protein